MKRPVVEWDYGWVLPGSPEFDTCMCIHWEIDAERLKYIERIVSEIKQRKIR